MDGCGKMKGMQHSRDSNMVLVASRGVKIQVSTVCLKVFMIKCLRKVQRKLSNYSAENSRTCFLLQEIDADCFPGRCIPPH